MNLTEIKILGAAGVVILLCIGYGLWHHKVYEEGVNHCQLQQAKAIQKSQETARVEIQKTEVKYEAQKKTVSAVQGGNPVAGPHVSAAIVGLPDSSGSR